MVGCPAELFIVRTDPGPGKEPVSADSGRVGENDVVAPASTEYNRGAAMSA